MGPIMEPEWIADALFDRANARFEVDDFEQAAVLFLQCIEAKKRTGEPEHFAPYGLLGLRC